MTPPTQLLRPAVACPGCGSAPRLRIPAEHRERYRQDPPGRTVATLQCHRCHRVYPVLAAAFQRAQ